MAVSYTHLDVYKRQLLDVYAASELAAKDTESKEFFRVSDIELLIACDRIKNPDYSDEEAERFEELLADKEREDVYKRQELYVLYGLFSYLKKIKFFQKRSLNHTVHSLYGAETVSYTHLDVYKRQYGA